jgi:hypothetical protein
MNNVVYEIQIGPYKQIGSTNDLERRMSEHLNLLKKEAHDNSFMQNVYNKYKTFSYTVLQCFLTREDAYGYEQQLLNEYYCKPGYLMMSNHATGFMSGDSHPNKSSAFRKAQSFRMKSNNPMRDLVSVAKKVATLKAYRLNNPQNLDYLRTDEVSKKRIDSLKQYYNNNPKNQKGINNPNAKKILNVQTGEIYNTGRDAAVSLGLKPSWVSTLAKKGIKLRFI